MSSGGRAHPQAALWAAVACGFAVRLWFAGTSGLYLDEAQVLAISTLPSIPDLLRYLAFHESHPPAFYLLVRLWLWLFGNSTTAGLSLALVAGSLLIPLCYALVLRLFASRRDALVAAWLVALSPTVVRYSGMVRPYVVLEVLVVAGLYCMASFIQSGRWQSAFGYAATGTLLVYTHNWSWLVLAGLDLVAVLWLIVGRKPRRHFLRLVAANLIIVACFLPWLPALIHQAAVAGHLWGKSIPAELVEATWVLTGFPLEQAVLICLAVGAVMMLRSRAGVHLVSDRKALVTLCLGAVILATVLAIVLTPVSRLVISQCYAMLTPLVLIAVAVLLQLDQLPARQFAIGLLVVCLVASVGRIVVTAGWVRSDMREIGAFLTARVRDEDLVLIYPDYPAPTLARYFSPPGQVFTYPHGGFPKVIPFDGRIGRDRDSAGLVETAAEVARSAAAGRRVWLVTLENPAHYPPQRLELERAFARVYGRAACVFPGSDRPRLYEDMMVILFAAPGGSADPTPLAKCR